LGFVFVINEVLDIEVLHGRRYGKRLISFVEWNEKVAERRIGWEKSGVDGRGWE